MLESFELVFFSNVRGRERIVIFEIDLLFFGGIYTLWLE